MKCARISSSNRASPPVESNTHEMGNVVSLDGLDGCVSREARRRYSGLILYRKCTHCFAHRTIDPKFLRSPDDMWNSYRGRQRSAILVRAYIDQIQAPIARMILQIVRRKHSRTTRNSENRFPLLRHEFPKRATTSTGDAGNPKGV